jgi:GTP pyrophosphokinase
MAVKQKFTYLADGHVDIEAWLQKISQKYGLTSMTPIATATEFARLNGKGLTTFYGQPCIEQSLEIAEILLAMQLDEETIIAAIIYCPLLSNQLDKEILQKNFADNILKLVFGAQQMNILDQLASSINISRNQIQIDRLRKTFLAMVSDIRVVLIKLAERTCIMRGIRYINSRERKRIAEETMNVYAPLANRLGLGQVKWELEDISFHYTHPESYKAIAKFLAERRVDRESHITEIIALLKNALTNANIHAKVTGRAKHIYSIFLKTQRKHVDYKNIYDVSAVRILVSTLDECYSALSIAHSLFEHIPAEFDDYISKPKPNGYRSIHTAVRGPNNKNLEIQIRTSEMHDKAEYGVAAHWLYKENKTQPNSYETKITSLRQLLEWHKDLARKETLPQQSLTEIEDRIYVFTPQNEIIDLPRGATPLDYAYHIHSEVGHHCRGAKINGHIVPLIHELKTGNKVEIITSPNATPSRDWLNKDFGYVTTSRARAKIAHWFKQFEYEKYVEIGKTNLERELLKAHMPQPNYEKLAALLHYKTELAFFAAYGHGNIRLNQVLQALKAPLTGPVETPAISEHASLNPNTHGLHVAGMDRLLTRIAFCCKPLPGDSVIGFITQGRGVTVHRTQCNNIINLIKHNDHRLLAVDWSQKPSVYYADINIQAYSQADLLKEISVLITHDKMQLIQLNTTTNRKTNVMLITLTLQINHAAQLNHFMTHLKQLPSVIEVTRSHS